MTSPLPPQDDDLKELLRNWSLDQHYNHFVEEKITIKHLRLMQSKFIDKLFQNLPMGDQILFEHHLQIWKLQILLDDSSKTSLSKLITPKDEILKEKEITRDETKPEIEISNSDSVEILDNKSQNNISIDINDKSDTEDNSDIEMVANLPQQIPMTTIPVRRSIVPTPRSLPKAVGTAAALPAPRYSHAPHKESFMVVEDQTAPLAEPIKIITSFINGQTCRYDLQKILTETSGGRTIFNYYSKHQHLREEHRTALINVIARYIDANGCNLTLSESNLLEDQIIKIFPTEKSEFYRTGKRGRLYNKMANMRRGYKKFNKDTIAATEATSTNSGASSPTPSGNSTSVIKEESMDEYNEYDIHNLRAKDLDKGNFIEFWTSTQAVRLKHIDDIESLMEIMEKWPEYKDITKIEYISMDFYAKYPNATKFSEIFTNSLNKLEKLLFTKVSTCSAAFKTLQLYQKASKESQHLLILWVIHQLFPPTHHMVTDANGVKRKKRYSILDSQNATICIRSSMASIDSYLQSRFTSTPPMLLVVGELGLDIQQIYVYFEEVRYPTKTVVQAAELCLQLYFLFNLDFPEEANLYYNFMQTYFLNIEPEVKNSKIYTTINDLNAY